MRCEQADVKMADVLAGEGSSADREDLDRHLVVCSACREDFELARAGACAAWPDEPVPARLADAARAAWMRPVKVLRTLRAVTAVAASICVAALLVRSGGAPASREEEAPPPSRPPVMAFVEPAGIGSLVAKDLEGRPVGELGLRSHAVSVEILDGIARTTIEENFENHTGRRLEGTFMFPLPSDASISRLALEVNGKMEEGTVLERERAREVFESIVRKMKDPALLEWMPGGLFKCRVFPIEPHATKRVIVAYTQALPTFRGRMTYVYPLASEKTREHPPGEVRIDVRARFAGRLESMESPSHALDVERPDIHRARASFRASNYRPTHDFVLTLQTDDDELRLVPHKVDGQDGYFALFLTPEGGARREPGRFTFVLDVSATVSESELEVARRLVRAMMEREIEGDRFEILAHHVDVRTSGPVDLRAANEFMDGLRPEGASDVLAALRAAPGDSEIIYIGEGQATFGVTDPARIAEAVKARRIRSIGVGRHANIALLKRLGGVFHISPNDAVDSRVRVIAATFGRPILRDLKLDAGEALYDVAGIRDVHYGERLMVTGRYRGPAAKVVVSGREFRRELEIDLPLRHEGNNWVRRLWAQRKITDLLGKGGQEAEVVRLGVEHQIITPHTSFLVLESEKMWKDFRLDRVVQKQDEVLGRKEKKGEAKPRSDVRSVPEDSFGDEIRRLLQEATDFYSEGRFEVASSRFEEAFQMKPNSDQVDAFIKRAGEDVVASMMNSPERKMQDVGRRLFELAKPGPGLREGKAEIRKYLEDLKSDRHEVWRNSFFHLKNFGPYAVKDLIPALASQQQDRFRARVLLILTEMGMDASLAVAEALESNDPFMRQQAAIVLGNVKDERTLPALAKRLEDPEELPEVKKFVKEAIRKIDRTAPAIDSSDPDLRRSRQLLKQERNYLAAGELRAARTLIGGRKEREAVGVLRRLVGDYGDTPAAQQADRLIEKLEKDSDGELVRLNRDLNDLSKVHSEELAQFAAEHGTNTNLADLLRELESSNRKLMKTQADQEVFVRQLEVQLAQIQELTTKVEEHRQKLAVALNAKSLAVAEVQYARQMAERLQQDLAALERKHIEVTRGKKSLEERVNHLNQIGVSTGVRIERPFEGKPVEQALERRILEEKITHLSRIGVRIDIAPKKPLEAKVTAVAPEIGLVVISIGKDDGVLEGDEFAVYRGGDFVAKIVIDRADRKWSAGKVVLKKMDPRVADDASNHVFVSAPRQGAGSSTAGPIRVLRLDGGKREVVVGAGTKAGLAPGTFLAITRDSSFVAIVLITEVSESESRGKVWVDAAVGTVRVGDTAEVVSDLGRYLVTLSGPVRKDVESRANLERIRARMRMNR